MLLRRRNLGLPHLLLSGLGLLLLNSLAMGQSRWSRTATDGGGLQLGDPTTVTWGIVADGTTINRAYSNESQDPSSLIGFLDGIYGDTNIDSDLTQRNWFPVFDSIFQRWDAVSGLKFVYEPNDDGSFIGGGSASGALGVRADVRISGHSIDGQSGSNTLAYNYFPDNGDMVIDTDNLSFYGNTGGNSLRLRNVLAHEFGHGMGLPHYESNNSRGLMEPFIDLNFDGPQIDDIHQAQRRYGDAWEENGGNDSVAEADFLGVFNGTALAVGTDANQSTYTEIQPNQVDFMSIDDNDDIDVWAFSLTDTYDLTLLLDMVGPTYSRGPQGGTQSSYNLASLSDLDLELIGSDGTSILASSMQTGLDLTEQINWTLGPGTYYARITGRDNAAQFYEFRLSGVLSAVPEPSGAMVLLLLGGWCAGRRRRIAV